MRFTLSLIKLFPQFHWNEIVSRLVLYRYDTIKKNLSYTLPSCYVMIIIINIMERKLGKSLARDISSSVLWGASVVGMKENHHHQWDKRGVFSRRVGKRGRSRARDIPSSIRLRPYLRSHTRGEPLHSRLVSGNTPASWPPRILSIKIAQCRAAHDEKKIKKIKKIIREEDEKMRKKKLQRIRKMS